MTAVVRHDAAVGGSAVRVAHDFRNEAQAVVWFAEALVVAAAQQLRDRLRVAVGGEDVEQRVEAHPERIDLPVREMLDAAAVHAEAERVARRHLDDIPVLAGDFADVV